jgi:mycoredoxin
MNASDQRIVMHTTTWCGDCWRAKRVFAALEVPFREVNVERDQQAAGDLRRLNGGMMSVPTIVFPDGSRMVEPRTAALETRLEAFISGER